MRVVFDTNVLVAAFAAEGLCAKLLRRANRREFPLFIGPVIIDEFRRALRTKLGASDEDGLKAVALLKEIAAIVEKAPSELKPARISRDPDDDAILAFAAACRADVLVTGDNDLLVLKTQGNMRILNPRDFELLCG